MSISVTHTQLAADLKAFVWSEVFPNVYQATNSEVLRGDHRIVERYGRREEIIVGEITSRRVAVLRFVAPDRTDIRSWHRPERFYGYLTQRYIRSHTIAMLGNVLAG